MKQRLKISNVALDGFAFAINEETGQTVFLSRQLCHAHEISEDDVAREIDCLVTEGAKGPQASTLTFVEEIEDDRYEELIARIEALEEAVGLKQCPTM